jgi:hypothetical protein
MATEVRFDVREDEFARDIQFFLKITKTHLHRSILVRQLYIETGRKVAEMDKLIAHLTESVEWYKNELHQLVDEDRYPPNYKTEYKL